MMKKLRYIIGIDEVGRGALAGPVVVAVVILSKNFQTKIRVNPLLKNKNPRQSASISIIKLRDSKKLTPRQREIWFEYIKTHPRIFYATANVSPKIIDKINISNAANLAATRALLKLLNNNAIALLLSKKQKMKVFLDGGLYINKPTTDNSRLTTKNCKIKTIIKGDEKIPAIMLASIIAKVSRDRLMKKLHGKYPRYDFINNVGYGTKKHLRAIKKYGRLLIHRKSFRIK